MTNFITPWAIDVDTEQHKNVMNGTLLIINEYCEMF